MKISIDPYNSNNNKYIDLMKQSIRNLGIDICEFNVRNLENIEFCMLNWYESLYANSLISQIYVFIKKYLILKILKLKRKKIIWVVHNRIPHDNKNTSFSKIIMKYLAKNSYKIIIHSNESKNVVKELSTINYLNEKYVYIPHPNYIGVYKEDNINNNEKEDDILELLFIGVIKPYKNVDLLIEAFNELELHNVRLKLAGKVVNKSYEEYINKLINNNENIVTDFRFIEDDELNGVIRKSDMLVLPYDIKSSLNSGTIILSFSNERTVLSPMIGTLKDFEDKTSFFGYEYFDEENHKKALKDNILRVYETYKNDKDSINNMGKKCYKAVKENNSIEIVSKCLREVFCV